MDGANHSNENTNHNQLATSCHHRLNEKVRIILVVLPFEKNGIICQPIDLSKCKWSRIEVETMMMWAYFDSQHHHHYTIGSTVEFLVIGAACFSVCRWWFSAGWGSRYLITEWETEKGRSPPAIFRTRVGCCCCCFISPSFFLPDFLATISIYIHICVCVWWLCAVGQFVWASLLAVECYQYPASAFIAYCLFPFRSREGGSGGGGAP